MVAPPDPSTLPVRLSMTARWIAGIIGSAAAGGGTAAIFIKNNSGGSLALVATGAVFLLMAVTGHGVRSFKLGSNEFVMDRVETAQVLKDEGDDEAAEEVLDELIANPEPRIHYEISTVRLPDVPEGFRARRFISATETAQFARGSAAMYAYDVERALELVIADHGWFLANPPGFQRFDFLLRLADSQNVAVEVRAGIQIRINALTSSLRARIAASDLPLDAVFVVVRAEPDNQDVSLMMEKLRLPVPFLVWSWRPEDGSQRMREGLDSLRQKIRENRG